MCDSSPRLNETNTNMILLGLITIIFGAFFGIPILILSVPYLIIHYILQRIGFFRFIGLEAPREHVD